MHNNKTIKNLPASERPYEKFLSLGASGLSDADLLAIIIKTGTRDKTVIDIAQDILSGRHGNLLNLYEMSYEELLSIPGIGQIKAIQLKAIAELSLRIAKTKKVQSIRMNNPQTIADYYMEQMRPSGDCTPSRNDIAVTDRLIEGSGIFSIELCDHIIIGDNEYYSFYENKLI